MRTNIMIAIFLGITAISGCATMSNNQHHEKSGGKEEHSSRSYEEHDQSPVKLPTKVLLPGTLRDLSTDDQTEDDLALVITIKKDGSVGLIGVKPGGNVTHISGPSDRTPILNKGITGNGTATVVKFSRSTCYVLIPAHTSGGQYYQAVEICLD